MRATYEEGEREEEVGSEPLALFNDQRGEKRNAQHRTVKERLTKKKQAGKNGRKRDRGRERDKTEPVTLDERTSHCGLQLGMAGGRA